MTIKFSDITGGGIPYGDNAGRPANPGIGKLYSNGEAQRLELYTASGWNNIVQEVPGVSGVTGQYLETNSSNTIQIVGTNFVSGALAYAIGTNGIEVPASSTTFNSIVSLSATFSGLSSVYEPYDIKVVNTSNLFGILPDALFINQSPIWQTSSGSLGTFTEGASVSVSVSATDPDQNALTYSSSNLPVWLSLNSSTGALTGTAPTVTGNTAYSFSISASDGSNPSISRSFSLTINNSMQWTTPAGALTPINEFTRTVSYNLGGTTEKTVIYSISSGTIPTGLSLNSSTGVLSGTAESIFTSSSFNFTVSAVDSENTYTRSYSIYQQATTSSVFNSNSGSIQTWTAPAGVSQISLKMWGAGGGGTSGGQGGFTSGIFSVTPLSTYNIYVGKTGPQSSSARAWPGGGKAGETGGKIGYGGGGYTALQNSSNNAWLAVAGGGGGAGNQGTLVGNGGGTSGGDVVTGYGTSFGGTQTAGGTSNIVIDNPCGPGSAFQGGDAAIGGQSSWYGGGGGGAGYYGGASGETGGGAVSGGAGGSGYVNTSYSPSGTTILGYGTDSSRGSAGNPNTDGKVIITY